MKYRTIIYHKLKSKSPSTRREWIEILSQLQVLPDDIVSLHAEGVIKLFVLRLKCGIDGGILVV